MTEIRKTLSEPKNAAAFSAVFMEGYLTPAFGARSKSEVDLLVFTALVEAKVVKQAADLRVGQLAVRRRAVHRQRGERDLAQLSRSLDQRPV